MEQNSEIKSRVELDLVLLNIEAAVRITRRAEFFSWVQGVFQSAIAHEALVCGLALPGLSGLSFEWQGSYPIAPELFAHLCAAEHGLMYRAARLWSARGHVPLLLSAAAHDGARSEEAELLQLLERCALDNLIAHGLPGLDGRPAGFFALGKIRGKLAERDGRMLGLLTPYLYAAWLRIHCNSGADPHRDKLRLLLTVRELEILGWMHKGKSNAEIGQILGISQLTVKNHVQKILRKLDAQNRTQAVAKGMSFSITR
jgi:transcriptional regulator EpsA